MGSWGKATTGSAGKIATDSRLAGDSSRHHGDGSEAGLFTPVSRRGFLAALAIAAGLGLMGASDALAYAAVDFGPGAGYIGPSKESGDLTHPDRTRGANDRWFGYANNWDFWNIYNDYSHRLGYAFAMVFECDWSDELYDHIVFRPFYYCTSYCATNPWRGYWLGRDDGDDNKGTCYIDGVPVGNFVGNLINDGSEGEDRHVNPYGWLYHGFYEGPGWSTFLRRRQARTGHNVYAHIDIFNCWKNNVRPSSAIVSSQNAPKDRDMSVQTDKIYIDNDMSLMGGIFKIIPVTAPNLRVDLVQGHYENNVPVARYENGRSTCLYHDYDGVNQNWMFWPNKSDGLGCFTFCIANMIGPGLDRGLDNYGHTSPTMERGYAKIWRNPESTNLTNSWWVHHEPAVTNETDHKCWFITSDADGQRLDTWGGYQGRQQHLRSRVQSGVPGTLGDPGKRPMGSRGGRLPRRRRAIQGRGPGRRQPEDSGVAQQVQGRI